MADMEPVDIKVLIQRGDSPAYEVGTITVEPEVILTGETNADGEALAEVTSTFTAHDMAEALREIADELDDDSDEAREDADASREERRERRRLSSMDAANLIHHIEEPTRG